MSLTSDQAKTLAADVIANAGGTTINTSDAGFEEFTSLLSALDFLVPGAGETASRVVAVITGRSVTVPGPAGPLVVLGHDAVEPLDLAVAATEQAVHAAAMRKGQFQSWADFIGDGELRAKKLAHAVSAGAFVHYLLTGQTPNVDELVRLARAAAAPLSLSERDELVVRVIATSTVEGLPEGERPPVAAAGAALRWLREHAPGAIVPDGWTS